MSFLGKLFGSSDAASDLVNNLASGLDKLSYSHEEKAETHAKDVSESRTVLLEWLKSTSGSRLARRLIALIVTSIWAMQYITAQALSIAAIWSDSRAEKLRDSAQIITDNAQSSNGAMMLVLAFYFAAPHMGAIVGQAMDKFSGKQK